MPPSTSPTVGTISPRHRDPRAASGYGLRPEEGLQRFGRGVPAVGSGMGSDGAYSVHRGAGSVVEIAARVRLLPPEQWGWDGTPWDADDPTATPGIDPRGD